MNIEPMKAVFAIQDVCLLVLEDLDNESINSLNIALDNQLSHTLRKIGVLARCSICHKIKSFHNFDDYSHLSRHLGRRILNSVNDQMCADCISKCYPCVMCNNPVPHTMLPMAIASEPLIQIDKEGAEIPIYTYFILMEYLNYNRWIAERGMPREQGSNLRLVRPKTQSFEVELIYSLCTVGCGVLLSEDPAYVDSKTLEFTDVPPKYCCLRCMDGANYSRFHKIEISHQVYQAFGAPKSRVSFPGNFSGWQLPPSSIVLSFSCVVSRNIDLDDYDEYDNSRTPLVGMEYDLLVSSYFVNWAIERDMICTSYSIHPQSRASFSERSLYLVRDHFSYRVLSFTIPLTLALERFSKFLQETAFDPSTDITPDFGIR